MKPAKKLKPDSQKFNKVRTSLRRDRQKTSSRLINFPKLVRLTIWFLIIVAILFIAFRTYQITTSLLSTRFEDKLNNKPLNTYIVDQKGLKKMLFVFEDNAMSNSGESQVQVLSASLILYNEKNNGLIVYYIPGWVYMRDYSGKYDNAIAISDLRYVGETINPSRSYEYAVAQIQSLTGLSIDTYVWFSPEAIRRSNSLFGNFTDTLSSDEAKNLKSLYLNPEEEVSNDSLTVHRLFNSVSPFTALVNYQKLPELSASIYSNKSVAEVLSEADFLRQRMANGDINMIDLSQKWGTREVDDGNGKMVNQVDLNQLDLKFANFIDTIRTRELEREQVKVEVYNGSEISKIAERYARRINNSGCEVIRYENSPAQYEKTTIYVSNLQKFDESLKVVKSSFLKDVVVTEGRPSFLTTGDIVVILGKDLQSEGSWE